MYSITLFVIIEVQNTQEKKKFLEKSFKWIDLLMSMLITVCYLCTIPLYIYIYIVHYFDNSILLTIFYFHYEILLFLVF